MELEFQRNARKLTQLTIACKYRQNIIDQERHSERVIDFQVINQDDLDIIDALWPIVRMQAAKLGQSFPQPRGPDLSNLLKWHKEVEILLDHLFQ